jgi:alcohol dehydrogenase (cytochrome c)
VLALHVATGKLAWGFQEVHHDIWDYDAEMTPILTNVKIGGKTVKIVWSINKDNYDYTLNALTGKPALPTPEVAVPQNANEHTFPTQPVPVVEMPGSKDELVPHIPTQPQAWSGQAPNGKPFVFPSQIFTPFDSTIYVVGTSTGVSWPEQAYSPKTGDIYLCVNQGEGANSALPAADTHIIAGNSVLFGRLTASSPLYTDGGGHFEAVDPATLHKVWDVKTPGVTCTSQVITTGSGLAIISRLDGNIYAYNQTDGSLAWTLKTGSIQIPRFGIFGTGGKEYLVVSGTSTDTTQPNGLAYWLRAYSL